jgi:hypothetical protein
VMARVNSHKLLEVVCGCILGLRDGELIAQLQRRGLEDGMETLLAELEQMFSQVAEGGGGRGGGSSSSDKYDQKTEEEDSKSDTSPRASAMPRLSRGLQAVLLSLQFGEDEDGTYQSVLQLEELSREVFTTADYSEKIIAARILVFCYLYINKYFGADMRDFETRYAIDHISAMFDALCESPEIAEALHYELGKKSYSSLPGGRKSRQILLKDIADIRHDVQSLTGYLLDIRHENCEEVVLLHDMKPYQLVAHTDTIHEMLVHNRCLFTASADGTIKIWDCLSLSPRGLLTGHKKAVLCLAASGAVLFSGSADRTIRVWDLGTQQEAKISLRKHQNEVTSMAIHDGRLYSASADSTILVWSTAPVSDVPVGALRGHGDGVLKLLPLPRQNRLLSGCRDSTIKAWDLDTMTEIFSFVNPGVISSVMAVSLCESMLFTSSWDNTVKVWSLGDRGVGEPPALLRGHRSPVNALAAAGDRLYSGSVDGTTKVWSVGTLTVLSSHPGHGERVTAIAPDGGTFFSASSDKSTIRHFSGINEVIGEC